MVDSSRSRSWDDRDPREWRESRDDRPALPPDDWDGGPSRRTYRRPEPRLEQRLDQWMTAGRQLVDGVAGARPGSRPPGRGSAAAAGSRLRPGDLGRWVEEKIDWLLEDDDGWREPWQEPSLPRSSPAPRAPRAERQEPEVAPPARGVQPPATTMRRRPLEAVSRRGTPLLPAQPPQPAPPLAGDDQAWPDDASFSVSRWRREPGAPRPERGSAGLSDAPAPAARPTRAVPRSSRRRFD